MASPSYRERMKAARAAASAERKAQQAEWHRRLELSCEVRRLALNATKAAIKARGDKLQLYTAAQLKALADEMIGPWLVAVARARIAERNLKDLHSERSAEPQGLLLCRTHDRKGATR